MLAQKPLDKSIDFEGLHAILQVIDSRGHLISIPDKKDCGNHGTADIYI